MGTIKKLISVNELQPGMIAVKEIKYDGKVLIGQGVAITEAAIKKLRANYFLNHIEVYWECEEPETLEGTQRVKTVEEIEQSFNDFSFNVEEIFDSMESLKKAGIEEVRNFAKQIQDELKSVSSVVKNIVIHGSGSDTIFRHSVNVAALASVLGRWIGFDENQINLLTYCGILHDFGKTKINKEILGKAGTLTAKEFKEIKTHPVLGYNFIKEIPYLDSSVSYGVLMHHERMDGSGYPLGVKADKIHPFARIIAIADVFDAVNSDRVYKKSKGPFDALEVIHKEGLGKLDYEYCKVFLSHVVNYYMGESVLLNNNRVCKIIQVDANNISRPLLFDDSGFIDLKQEKNLYVERLMS